MARATIAMTRSRWISLIEASLLPGCVSVGFGQSLSVVVSGAGVAGVAFDDASEQIDQQALFVDRERAQEAFLRCQQRRTQPPTGLDACRRETKDSRAPVRRIYTAAR